MNTSEVFYIQVLDSERFKIWITPRGIIPHSQDLFISMDLLSYHTRSGMKDSWRYSMNE